MDSVIRAVVVYVFLMIIFRIGGKRSLAQITTFDFVLLLVVSEATQNALVGEDFSIVNSFLVITTLVGIDIGLSLFKRHFPQIERYVEGMPLVIVENGKPLKERMAKARVDEEDVLAAARATQGLERLDQIKYAVLERSGGISIVPQSAES